MRSARLESHLKKCLAHRKMTGADLGRRLGVSRSVVTRYCSGTREPGVVLAVRIARILDVTVSQIWPASDDVDLASDATQAELSLGG